jgi:diguanylate cyclase (GGDEF)-like protein
MTRLIVQGHGRNAPMATAPGKHKLILSLVLSSVIPLLVAAYGLYAAMLLPPDPERQARDLPWLLALLGLAALSTVAGAAMLRHLLRLPGRASDMPVAPLPGPAPLSRPFAAPAEPEPAGDEDKDEMESLMDSFSRMLSTIEQQASEINQFTVRLDSAYKEIETSNARLKEFSFKDEVTGLYNRRFFSIRLEEEVSRYRRFNHPVAVVLLDLDGFKAVNDELGHAAGDETLRGMAEILLKHSRGINVICRYGGDEFAILLVETSKAGARLYADRIRYVLPTFRFSHGRRITASFGIASLPEDVAPSADDLIRAADEALYAAKRAGKNRVSVHEDIVPAQPSGRGSTAE